MGNVTLPLHQWITTLRNVRSEMPDDFAYQRNLIREVDSVINGMVLSLAANAVENARGVGACKYGDAACPCQDGDVCHYEGLNPMAAPDGVGVVRHETFCDQTPMTPKAPT